MQTVLSRIYLLSAVVISAVMLVVCFFLGWSSQTTVYTLIASCLICAPALIIVNAFCWLLKRIEMTISIAWMMMFSLVPVFVALPAFAFANELPGDVLSLMTVGVLSCYAGILSQAVSIARYFKSLNGQHKRS